MKFDPQSFFIGIIDFFSVLLPGSLLSYFVFDYYYPCTILHFSDTKSWAIFFVASYLSGHFIFLLGASILDNLVYDVYRNSTDKRQMENLAKGKRLSLKLMRWLAKNLNNPYADKALKSATDIKTFYLNPLLASGAVNTFQWCKSKLDMEASSAFSLVQGFEAHSKFFRSLVVVLFFLLPWYLYAEWHKLTGFQVVTIILFGIIVILLALWRYAEQRDKATRQAYWSIITLEASREKGFRQRSTYRSDGLTHAGGLVYRRDGDKIRFLLIRPKKSREDWILPKGHIDSGEHVAETAVREIREETGIWARIVNSNIYSETKFTPEGSTETVRVRFYLAEYLEEASEKRKEELEIEIRDHQWVSPMNDTKAELDRVTSSLNIPQESKNVIVELIPQIPKLPAKGPKGV
jgi:8-oxo-dGTP pyrophosphatase MutT (NUDIX family)